jgi:uncharacterized protein YjdB
MTIASVPSQPSRQRRNRPFRPNTVPGIVLIALLAACSSGDQPSPAGPSTQLTTIAVSSAGAEMGVGQSQRLTAEGRTANGVRIDGLAFSWVSSNVAVATVVDGTVTGVAAGTTSITASSGGITSAPLTITVSAGTAGTLVIDKAAIFLPGVGATAQLTARVVDDRGVSAVVSATWTSSAPADVTVDASGRVIGAAIGSAMIVAESNGRRTTPTLVTVAEPKAGALLVMDAQVVSIGDVAAGGRYDVAL